MRYPVVLTKDENGTVIAEFPDVPGAMTVGRDEDDALEWALDALLVMFSGLMDAKELIPPPSLPEPGQATVEVPPMAVLKLAVYSAMREQSVSQLRLASCLRTDARAVRRLLDLDHNSRLDHLEMALAALGYSFDVSVRKADDPPPIAFCRSNHMTP